MHSHRPSFWLYALLPACVSLALLLAPTDAHAAHKKAALTTDAAPKKGRTKVKHTRSSAEESSAERDRRLYRECRGRPNAGACLGYTQR